MGFNYLTAKALADKIKREKNGKVTRAQLSQLLRETTNCMTPHWIRSYAMSMATAGLIREVEDGVFEVCSSD